MDVNTECVQVLTESLNQLLLDAHTLIQKHKYFPLTTNETNIFIAYNQKTKKWITNRSLMPLIRYISHTNYKIIL